MCSQPPGWMLAGRGRMDDEAQLSLRSVSQSCTCVCISFRIGTTLLNFNRLNIAHLNVS